MDKSPECIRYRSGLRTAASALTDIVGYRQSIEMARDALLRLGLEDPVRQGLAGLFSDLLGSVISAEAARDAVVDVMHSGDVHERDTDPIVYPLDDDDDEPSRGDFIEFESIAPLVPMIGGDT